MVAQLIDEARLSLENKDRVSLSVIANRYTSEQDVTRILIKDNKDDILVPVGNAPMQQGDTIRQIATNGDAVIGSVALTLKDVSKGEIIAMQWPFVIGTMLLHLLLWLIYGYLARPTKEQISALSRNIQDLYREQYSQGDQRGYSRDLERGTTGSLADGTPSDSQMAGLAAKSETAGNAAQARPFNVHNEVNEYLRTQQNQSSSDETGSLTATSEGDIEDKVVGTVKRHSSQSGGQTSKLSATRAVDSVRVQIVFHDEFNMLERLAPAQRLPYLALCTQLLNQAVTELLKQPLLLGVSATNEAHFEDDGASVVLKRTTAMPK
ncbi:hypothetical protein PKHYL_35260 [Psychrobacter sp. KH172YL61]|nr:hypothetical protein PKHYL_35260 [Psychrobacter sp. KH172YL61]